jgi:uncharacterized protein YicC (UPF0701 family)
MVRLHFKQGFFRMAIASMTGFAREAGVAGPYQWAWEIKTVNGRGLEVRVRTPSGFDAPGEEARGQILKAITRGQGQLNLTLSKVATTTRVTVNREVLRSLVEALAGLDLPRRQAASLDGSRRAGRGRDRGRGRRSWSRCGARGGFARRHSPA